MQTPTSPTAAQPLRSTLVLLCLIAASAFAAAAPPPDHWVGTWAASPMALFNRDAAFGATDTTFREIVHVSLGGAQTRIVLSNEFGTGPLTIGAAHIALASPATAAPASNAAAATTPSTRTSDIDLTTANALTFSGSPTVTIPPGALVVSDPTNLKLPAFADLAVSLFLPAQTIQVVSFHGSGYSTNFSAPGNVVSARTLDSPKELYSWHFLKGVDVLAPAGAGAIVALGDSITDGTASTRDANSRWPDLLARRLAEDPKARKSAPLALLNEGIGGNRILHDNTGPNALARLDRDVLSQAGVKYLIVLEGINDIGHAVDPVKPYDVVSAQDLIAGLTQIAQRAHLQGIKVFGGTVLPYEGAKYASPAGEAIRQAVNAWIRTTPIFDGVIDFDKSVQDPTHPAQMRADDDHGDHLHPNDAGMKAMAAAIDLTLFTK